MNINDDDKFCDSIDHVISGNYAKLLEQLKVGLDPNYTEDGVSLLHYAVTYEQHAIAQLLINWGANRDQKDLVFEESPADLSSEISDDLMIDVVMQDNPQH